MPTIQLHRINELRNKMRDYRIFIDGNEAGTLANGQTREFVVSPGEHTITAHIDWCSSNAVVVDVANDETITLTVGGFAGGKWLFHIMAAIIAMHLLLITYARFDYFIYAIIPVFLWLLYYMSIGRKKYLTLTKNP